MAEAEINRDFLDLLREFNVHEVRFLIVGGLDASPGNARRAWNALAAFGAPLRELTPEDLATPGVCYQVGVAPRRIDVLNVLSGISFDEAWPRRVRVEYGGVPAHVIGRADLIRNKRALDRPQDRLDVQELERDRGE